MRTERLEAAYRLQVRVVHFPLHPDTPPGGQTLEQLFAGKGFDVQAANRRLAGLMQQEGLAMGDRTMTYNSRLAQELAAWAETLGAGGQLHSDLFRAYFEDNINLARVEELAAIAAGAGLEAGEAREVLDSRRFREAVDADWGRARELGVTGIPTFLAGGQRVTGAQPYDVLEKLVVGAGALHREGGRAPDPPLP